MGRQPVKANLFIAGAPKCGTTAWARYLESHPQVCFSPVKEPTYFTFDMPRIRLVKSFADYQRLFAKGGRAKIVAEASTAYFYSSSAAEAVAEYNPDARILIFLRNQEDLLPSLHHQFLYSFEENILDFEKAWHVSDHRPADMIPPTCRDGRLLDYRMHGRFHEHISRFFSAFPSEQICIIRFEDWTSDPRAAYLRILEFLGLDDDGRTEFPRVNEAKSHRNEALARFIMHPPKFALKIVSLIKRLTGKPSLKLVERAAKLIEVPGYRTSTSPQLRDEIRRYYEAENRALNELLATRSKARAKVA